LHSPSYCGVEFSHPLSYWDANLHAYLPDIAGVYAIQVGGNSSQLTPIFFGETTSIRDCHVRNHHQGISRWLAHPAAAAGLLISYSTMPNSSKAVREYLAGVLIHHYRPVCNLTAPRNERAVVLANPARRTIGKDALRGLDAEPQLDLAWIVTREGATNRIR